MISRKGARDAKAQRLSLRRNPFAPFAPLREPFERPSLQNPAQAEPVEAGLAKDTLRQAQGERVWIGADQDRGSPGYGTTCRGQANPAPVIKLSFRAKAQGTQRRKDFRYNATPSRPLRLCVNPLNARRSKTPLRLSLSKPGWPKTPFDKLRVSGLGFRRVWIASLRQRPLSPQPPAPAAGRSPRPPWVRPASAHGRRAAR